MDIDHCIVANDKVLHRGSVPGLDSALARWTRGGPMLREGVGFLIFAVLDAIVESYAPFISGIEDEIDETELAVLTRADEAGVMSLLRLRRDISALRYLGPTQQCNVRSMSRYSGRRRLLHTPHVFGEA